MQRQNPSSKSPGPRDLTPMPSSSNNPTNIPQVPAVHELQLYVVPTCSRLLWRFRFLSQLLDACVVAMVQGSALSSASPVCPTMTAYRPVAPKQCLLLKCPGRGRERLCLCTAHQGAKHVRNHSCWSVLLLRQLSPGPGLPTMSPLCSHVRLIGSIFCPF